MALPNITEYVKNVGKSIAYSAVDIIKNDMPTISGFAEQESNREVAKAVYSGIRDYRTTLKRAETAMKSSKLYEAAELGYKSALEDIRSGKFYNRDRIKAIEEKTTEEIFGSFEDGGFNENGDFSFGDDADITVGDRLVAASNQVASMKSAEMISETNIKTTGALIETQKATTRLLYTQNMQLMGSLRSSVLDVGFKTNSNLEALTNIAKTSAENSKTFYETSTKLAQESNAILKEMLEMQRSLYKQNQADNKTKSEAEKKIKYGDVVDSNGVLDISTYMKSIKRNAKSTLSERTGGMSDTLLDGFGGQGNIMSMFAASPLQFMSDAIVRAVLPKVAKESAKKFDKTISGLASTMLSRFNRMANDEDSSELAKIFGSIFGVRNRVKSSLDTSKYEKGPVPFDGKVRQTILNISEQLSSIESILSGQPQRVFDLDKGRWTTLRQIKRDYTQMRSGNKAMANSDLMDAISEYMKNGPKFSSKQQQEDFNTTLRNLMDAMYESGGDFKYKSENDWYKYGATDKDMFNLVTSILKDKNVKRARVTHANNVMSARETLNRRMEDLEKSGDSIYSYLFKGLDKKLFETPKYEEKAAALRSLNLTELKDNKGHNAYFYLQNIYNELYRIRSGGFNIPGQNAMGGSMAGNASPQGRLFREPQFQSPIKDEHEKSAKEKYYDSKLEADRRYQEMLKRHTEKGGKLFDITDGKGNIIALKANAEQRALMEQIKEQAETAGWFQDYFYGQRTKLDDVNTRRRRNQEDTIDTTKNIFKRMQAAKTLGEKYAVVQDQVNRVTRAPGEKLSSLIDKADAHIYKFLYGEETGEEDKEGKKIKGFMHLMVDRFNLAIDKVSQFADTILDKVKKQMGIDSFKDVLDKLGISPIIATIKSNLIGEKNSEGKYEGGIFGQVREETKNLFGQAKNFFVNSFKETFGPGIDWMRNQFSGKLGDANRRLADQDDLDFMNENGIGANRIINHRPKKLQNAQDSNNPQEATTAIAKHKRNIVLIINTTNFLNKDLAREATRISNRQTAIDFMDKVKSEYLSIPDARTKYRAKNTVFKISSEVSAILKLLKISPIGRPNLNTPAARQALRDHNQSLTDRAAEQERRSSIANANRSRVNQQAQFGRDNMLMQLEQTLGVRLAGDERLELFRAIDQLLPEGSGKNKLKDVSARDLYELNGNGYNFNTLAEALSALMANKYGNQDTTLGNILQGRVPNGPAPRPVPPGGNDLLNKVVEKLDNILGTLTLVVDNARKAVRVVRSTDRPPRPQPAPNNGRRSGRRDSNNRESESEGDSTGDSDSPHSSAYGNSFKTRSLSALSEGEIYENNGLLGKVPKTGVYDILGGTVIHPTKNNKIIELAKEQKAISSFVKSNATASNDTTRTIDGKTYNWNADRGAWVHYEIEGGQTYVTEIPEGLGNRMATTAKNGMNSFLTGLGFNGLADTSAVKTVDQAMEVVKKYAPKMTASGLLGAGIGLLAGNPLLGAAIGASAGFVGASDKAKTALFGKEVENEDGTKSREGGFISKESQDAIKKYLPSMSKKGIVGATLGLFTPFGLVGGAIIGSTIGWATTNDRVKEALFGNADDPKSGLISKDAIKNIKKAAPNVALGALGGMLLGPFGLMGNIVLGSGIGLASTTNEFKSFIFGEEITDENGNKTRKGGLVGAIKINVVDPLKSFANTFKTKAEDFAIDMINELKSASKPIMHELALLSSGALKFIPNMLSKLFESTFGRPLQDIIAERVLAPLSKVAGAAGKGAGFVARNTIGAPFRLIGAAGRGLQMKHIRKGDASYLSAEERLSFRDKHKTRGALSNIPGIGNIFGSLGFNPTGYRDEYKSSDETMAGMNSEQLEKAYETMKKLSANKSAYQKDIKKSGRGLAAKLSTYFGSNRRMRSAMESKDLNTLLYLIKTTPPKKGVTISDAEREELTQIATKTLKDVDSMERYRNMSADKREQAYTDLSGLGFKGINDKNIVKMSNLLKNELAYKKTVEGPKKEKTEDEMNRENADKNTDRVVNILEEININLEALSLNNLPKTKRRKKMEELEARRGDLRKRREDALASAENDQETTEEDIDELNDNFDDQDLNLIDRSRNRRRKTKSLIGRAAGAVGGAIAAPFKGIGKGFKFVFDPNEGVMKKYVWDKAAETYKEVKNGVNQRVVSAKQKIRENSVVKFTTDIANAIHFVFMGGTRKKTGEKKKFGDSLLGKAAKMLFGGAVLATGVAGMGHLGYWAKESLIPRIKGLWTDHISPWLQTHFSKGYEVLTKIAAFAKDIPEKIVTLGSTAKDFLLGTGRFDNGGLPYIFTNKILPWYLEGFGKFANTFLPPIVKGIVGALPVIGKAIIDGIGSWFSGDSKTKADKSTYIADLNSVTQKASGTDTSATNDAGSKADSIPANGTSGWWTKTSGGFDNFLNEMKVTADKNTESKQVQNVIDGLNNGTLTQEDLKSSGTTKNELIAQGFEAAKRLKPNENGGYDTVYDSDYTPVDEYGNTYDINNPGQSTSDNSKNQVNALDGVTSWKERVLGTLGRSAMVGHQAGGIKAIGKTLKGIGKLHIPLVSKVSRWAGRGVNAIHKTTGIMPNVGQALFKGQTFGGAIGKAGEWLSKSGSKTLAGIGEKIAGSSFAEKGAQKAAENLGEIITSKATKKFASSATKELAEDAVMAGAETLTKKAAKTAAKEGAESATKGLLEKIVKIITEKVPAIFTNKLAVGLAKEGMEAAGKEATEAVAKKFLQEAGEGMVKKLVKKVGESIAKAGSKLLAKVTTAVSTAGIATVAFAIYDFGSGMKNARDILGLSKDQEVGILERLIAGLLKCVNGFATFGLVPESLLVDLFVDVLAPIFNIDVSDLKKRREEAEDIVKEYNETHGTKYSVDEYNHKDSLYNKHIKPAVKNIAEGAKSLVNKGVDAFKGLWGGNKEEKVEKGTSYGTGKKSSKNKKAFGLEAMYGTGRVSQLDPRYANIPFNSSSDKFRQTIGDSGCGPAAAVNAVEYAFGRGTNNNIVDAANFALRNGYKEANGGTRPDFFNNYFQQQGLDSKYITNKSDMVKALKNGTPVVMMGKDNGAGTATPYGPNPHYVVGKGIDSKGNIIVDDPESADGNLVYKSGKVLNKTNLAIATSKYGMSKYGRGQDHLGIYVAKFESGGKGPLMISSGAGDYGGVSFGTYQFPSYKQAQTTKGNLPKFWNQYYASQYPGVTPGNNQPFKDAWTAAASANPNAFQANEVSFMYKNYYMPAVKALGGTFNPDTHSRAAQELLWATAIQYGPESAAKEFIGALQGVNPASLSPSQLVTRVEDYKASRVSTKFKSSSAAVQNSVRNRFSKEEKNALLAIAGLPPLDGPVGTGGAVMVSNTGANNTGYATANQTQVQQASENKTVLGEFGKLMSNIVKSSFNRTVYDSNGNPQTVNLMDSIMGATGSGNRSKAKYGMGFGTTTIWYKTVSDKVRYFKADFKNSKFESNLPSNHDKTHKRVFTMYDNTPKYIKNEDFNSFTGVVSEFQPEMVNVITLYNSDGTTTKLSGKSVPKTELFKEAFYIANIDGKNVPKHKVQVSAGARWVEDTVLAQNGIISQSSLTSQNGKFTSGQQLAAINFVNPGLARGLALTGTVAPNGKDMYSEFDAYSSLTFLELQKTNGNKAVKLSIFYRIMTGKPPAGIEKVKSLVDTIRKTNTPKYGANGLVYQKMMPYYEMKFQSIIDNKSESVSKVAEDFVKVYRTLGGKDPDYTKPCGYLILNCLTVEDNPDSDAIKNEPTVTDYNNGTVDETGTLVDNQGLPQDNKPTTILGWFSKILHDMFNFKDKEGADRNLLEIFGLSSGSNSSTAMDQTTGTNTPGMVSSASEIAANLGADMKNNFPYYNQADGRWGSQSYPPGGTISSSGCGPTSMAMVLRSFGNSVSPIDTAKYSVDNGFRVPNNGTSWGFYSSIAKNYGLNGKGLGTNSASVIDALKKGQPVIASMKPGHFTKGGHFIVLSGLDQDGNILINDPASVERSKAWDPNIVTSEAKQYWSFDKNGKGSIGNLWSTPVKDSSGTMTAPYSNEYIDKMNQQNAQMALSVTGQLSGVPGPTALLDMQRAGLAAGAAQLPSTTGMGKNLPLRRGKITSGFGDPTRLSHNGVDIAGNSKGQPVICPVNGTVIRSEYNDTNGNIVVVQDDNTGYLYSFSHLKSSSLQVGSKVKTGTIVGYVGSTGSSSGDHLHYQVTDTRGQFVNPNGQNQPSASIRQEATRAIGGGEGIDYTKLIITIIEVLGTIADNTDKVNKVIEILSTKAGVDVSDIDTSSSASTKKSLSEKLRSIMSSPGNSKPDIGTALMNKDTNSIIRAMNIIAQE